MMLSRRPKAAKESANNACICASSLPTCSISFSGMNLLGPCPSGRGILIPSSSSWPRSPPHWWQLSSSETASEAAYASFDAAARRMSKGRLRPRSVAAALQSAPGGGGAGGSDKQDARPRPTPVTPLPGGRARQCRPAGTRSPTPWRWGWGSVRTRPAKTSLKAKRPA